jgi:hypothetical protein
MTRSTCIALALAVLTCSSARNHGDEASAASGDSVPAAGSGKGSNGGSMASPFKEAQQRFLHEVASAYGKRASDFKINPADETIVGFLEENIADLIAFQATAGELEVRGFASKSAAVVGKRNDYGPLFQAARALDPAAGNAAKDVAARVVWMMGRGFRLVDPLNVYPRRPLPPQVTLPAIERGGQGAVLKFFYVKDDAMPGAPAAPFAAEVTCSADFKAALVSNPGP